HSLHHHDLLPFPTRRSSDLDRPSALSLAGRWPGSSTPSAFPRLFAISANPHWLAPTVFAPPRNFVRSVLMPFAAVVAVFGYPHTDRKSTRLNSSHVSISYAV